LIFNLIKSGGGKSRLWLEAGMRIFFLLALILSLVVTIFAVQNNAPVEVAFLGWNVTGSLALILMITFAVGIIIGVMFMLPSSIKARLSAHDERRQKRDLAAELERSQTAQQDVKPSEPPVSPPEGSVNPPNNAGDRT
jgi:putative membrane protein